jgi:hypothetical protein
LLLLSDESDVERVNVNLRDRAHSANDFMIGVVDVTVTVFNDSNDISGAINVLQVIEKCFVDDAIIELHSGGSILLLNEDDFRGMVTISGIADDYPVVNLPELEVVPVEGEDNGCMTKGGLGVKGELMW